jgi:uncharacterized 2Fe-2S/4Fe-4S cluster protein (DUF4445 family)
MAQYRVVFDPLETTVTVPAGTTLLEAAGRGRISIDSICGGDGICGRCKMIVKEGKVGGDVSALLTREEIRRGVVLACQTTVESDLLVEIPAETRAREKIVIDKDAQRFRADRPGVKAREFTKEPLVSKVFLQLEHPTLHDNLSDCDRLQTQVTRLTGITSMQMGLKIIQRLPAALRQGDFAVTATIGRRRDVAEIMDIEPGNTAERNYTAVADLGTSTVVVHLVDAVTGTTVDTQACFNSQATYGREVTARMISAEHSGREHLQELLVEDVNQLIASLAENNDINIGDIHSIVCAGNTAMAHFLLGLPTRNIRRSPYVDVSEGPPPFRAAEVGIKIHPRGLIFTVPGIGGWVGGDVAAGILATGLYEMDELGMFIDVGTNGEIVLGNKEWLIACSASAGPALEGASVACGMMAERGAIESAYVENGQIRHDVIGGGPPDGLCGSGIIDLIASLLKKGIIDRTGRFVEGSSPALRFEDGLGRYVVADKARGLRGREVYISQDDLNNVITAKAAIFAASKIMLDRLGLPISGVKRVFLAGGFGSRINMANAVAIGLLPDLPLSSIQYVGNTSIWGAKLVALSTEAYALVRDIAKKTTYYDLMGTDDYVEQFQQAMFLPHTNVELFPSLLEGKKT